MKIGNTILAQSLQQQQKTGSSRDRLLTNTRLNVGQTRALR